MIHQSYIPVNERRFLAFHRANPKVYSELVRLTRELAQTGNTKVGIGMLFEVLRWRAAMRTDADDFRLNNNYRAFYARLIMEREPDLRGIFDTRVQHAGAWHEAPAHVTVDGTLF